MVTYSASSCKRMATFAQVRVYDRVPSHTQVRESTHTSPRVYTHTQVQEYDRVQCNGSNVCTRMPNLCWKIEYTWERRLERNGWSATVGGIMGEGHQISQTLKRYYIFITHIVINLDTHRANGCLYNGCYQPRYPPRQLAYWLNTRADLRPRRTGVLCETESNVRRTATPPK
jgi:hypothetical protein